MGRQNGEMSIETTSALWEKYRAGSATACPNDGWPLALSVDAGGAYRFVCTHCGTASPWFEAEPHGIRARNAATPAAEPDYDGD